MKKKNRDKSIRDEVADDQATRNHGSGKSGHTAASSKPGTPDEAFDFTTMERKIAKAIEHMTHKFSEPKTGGAVSPAILEDLPVRVAKSSGQTVKLGDIAQVVTKGRHINIILNDEETVKPVRTAIQGSSLGVAPQGPADDAPTTLVITVPPPTEESKKSALAAATKVSVVALDSIRDARQQKHKQLRAMQLAKKVTPDDAQTAGKQMEQIIQRATKQVQSILDAQKKVLAR